MNKTIFFYILLIIVLIVFNSCKKDKSECLTCPPPPPDTTSHVIQWQAPDTLGTQGIIRDVWVFSKTDAWAVGEIYLNDSIGNLNMNTLYNAAHWDGTKWTPMRIPYDYGGQPFFGEIYSIFAFSTNDIWFAGGLIHWNGQQFTNVSVPSSVWGQFLIKKIWGTSSNNLYIVGNGGSIARYNGNNWTKMASNTTVDLQDIWGIDGSHIWATGTNTGDGHCVVLQSNGTSWTTIYDSNSQPAQSQYQFGTVWTNTPSSLYLDGGSKLRSLNLSNLAFGPEIETGQTYVTYKIRATRSNDIFAVSAAAELAHYNGSTWYLYPELKMLNNSSAFVFFYTIHPINDFVLVGGEFFTGLNGFPVVIRGYR